MDDSPFARLSPELRNAIYEAAFDTEFAITLQDNAIQHGITRTCRQLRRETLHMYYSLARFNAHLDDGPTTPLARWLEVLGRNNCLLLREVNVWDMHMLNATLHGLESTQKLLQSTTAEGKNGWYLKHLVVTLHHLGLEIRNLSLVNAPLDDPSEGAGSTTPKPERTSHFAIVPMSDDDLVKAPACRHPDMRDLLGHLGFQHDMIEEVFDGLEGTLVGRGDHRSLLSGGVTTLVQSEQREIRIRRGRRDIFVQLDGHTGELLSTREAFVPHEENGTM
ncbi:hypothetical protein LTR97_002974 [Elasticomyces elasticus]|uniref:Uncharacterized protein n=1 Tax=Elasticomyces elasticus TaxID=574655 RepID=A0AAN7ZPR6_9PEZI|nr:hypothetical protein LTR97_002974 [Elasticomyces elasticus]